MGTMPRQMRALADRLNSPATLARRGCWKLRQARAVVGAVLEHLRDPGAKCADGAAQRSYPPLPICYEAEFTQ